MKPLILLALIGISFSSCKKDKVKQFRNEGIITGVNSMQCPCIALCPCACGGLFFHFTDTAYNANIPLDNPGIFNLGSNLKFPVRAKVNWENTTRCQTFAIKISNYEIF